MRKVDLLNITETCCGFIAADISRFLQILIICYSINSPRINIVGKGVSEHKVLVIPTIFLPCLCDVNFIFGVIYAFKYFKHGKNMVWIAYI